MSFVDWLRRNGLGGLLSPTPSPTPSAGAEIDPIYGSVVAPGGNALGTTVGAADAGLPGNGGSYFAEPKSVNYGGLLSAGLDLMRMGEPGPAVGVGPSWQPQQSPIHRPAPIDASTMLAAIFPRGQMDPQGTAMIQQLLMQQRQRRPMGLLDWGE